jgi:hypothetical protein
MDVPVDKLRSVAQHLFEDREAVTRDEFVRAASKEGVTPEVQSMIVQIPPGAFTRDELLGEIRSLGDRYAESVPRRTSDYDPGKQP